MAECQQQREAVVGINREGSRLRIAEPPFGNEIVKEWVESVLAEVRSGLQRQGERDRRMPAREISCVVGEDATAAGLLRKTMSIDKRCFIFLPKL